MQRYRVPDMSCGHCVTTIEKAVKTVDPKAVIAADLAAHQVSVQTQTDAVRIAGAIRTAGYENEPIVG